MDASFVPYSVLFIMSFLFIYFTLCPFFIKTALTNTMGKSAMWQCCKTFTSWYETRCACSSCQQVCGRAWFLSSHKTSERRQGDSHTVLPVKPSAPVLSLAKMAHLTALFKYVDEHQDLYVKVSSLCEVLMNSWWNLSFTNHLLSLLICLHLLKWCCVSLEYKAALKLTVWS